MEIKRDWLKSKMTDSDCYSDAAEFADNNVDVWNKDLIDWLAMEGSSDYVDEAIELGAVGGIFNILQQGQYLELLDIWDEIYK